MKEGTIFIKKGGSEAEAGNEERREDANDAVKIRQK